MYTNKYYVTTIIAIFLSLSLGILIGGTLGQQWINQNQEKMITHYQEKSNELQKQNADLLKKQKEMETSIQTIQEGYHLLFQKSVAHMIEGRKILWINHSNQDLSALRNSITMAGGWLDRISPETDVFYEENKLKSANVEEYDLVLLFPNEEENISQYEPFFKYGIPVIYISQSQTAWSEKEQNAKNMYHMKLNGDSFYDHFQFVLFLKTLFQESTQ